MSAPPHFGFGLGPPDPGALDPGNVALHYFYMNYFFLSHTAIPAVTLDDELFGTRGFLGAM